MEAEHNVFEGEGLVKWEVTFLTGQALSGLALLRDGDLGRDGIYGQFWLGEQRHRLLYEVLLLRELLLGLCRF